MIHKLFLFVFLSWNFANAKVSQLIVSLPKEGNSYRIGDEVILTCNIEEPGDLSVLFRHKGKNMAENGISYDKDLYTAEKHIQRKPFEFTLMIKKLRWENHGLWECVHGDSVKEVSIVITVPGIVEAITSELYTVPADKVQLTDVSNPLPQILFGKGIKINPYDLTRNSRVKLHCRTGCSNPKSNHSWSYSNLTMSERIIKTTLKTSDCSRTNFNGFYTESIVIIGCNELQMVGSNEIKCKMNEYNDSQSIYILCPGGHKPWTLTNGEIIGLSIAFALAALMLVLFFMSAKKIINSYRYGAVVGGIRV